MAHNKSLNSFSENIYCQHFYFCVVDISYEPYLDLELINPQFISNATNKKQFEKEKENNSCYDMIVKDSTGFLKKFGING